MRLSDILLKKGHYIKLILAGREACSHIIRLKEDTFQCQYYFSLFSEKLKRNPQFQSTIIGLEESLELAVETSWTNVSKQSNHDRTFDGYNLHEICKVSLARRLRRTQESVDKIEKEIFNQLENSFHKDTIRHLLYYRKIFSDWKPDITIYFGGHFHQDRCAFLISHENDIKTVAIESTFIPERIYWDTTGVTGNRGGMASPTNLHWSEAVTISRARYSAINEMLKISLNISEDMWNQRDATKKVVRNKLSLNEHDKIALFICQVPYDSSVISDGGDFYNQITAITSILELFKRIKGYKLLIRTHPKDQDTKLRKYVEHMAKQRYREYIVNEISDDKSDFWFDLVVSDLAITVNSQAGLQAAWYGLPVLLLGNAFYGNKGFTHDVFGQKLYLKSAFTAAISSQTESSRLRLMSYLSILESKYMIDPKDLMSAVMKLTALL